MKCVHTLVCVSVCVAFASLSGASAISVGSDDSASVAVGTTTGGMHAAPAATSPIDEPAAVPTRAQISGARSVLVGLGITPQTLATAGVGANQAAAVAGLGLGEFIARENVIVGAALSCQSSAAACQRLEDRVQRGLANEEDIGRLQQVREDRDSDKQARDDAFSAFFSLVTVGLTNDQREALERMNRPRAKCLPIEFRVLDLSEGSTLRLREELAIRRIAQARGEQPPEAELEIGDYQTDLANAARDSLDENLATVEAAWNAILAN